MSVGTSWGVFNVSAAIALVFAVLLGLRNRTRSRKLPPGPPGDPFIGHVRFMKPSHPWLWYTELAKTYGDIVYTSALGTPIIVLNSLEAVTDLFAKRGAIYSDRPYVPMSELLGIDKTVVLARYSSEWKEQRRLFHTYLGKDAIHDHYDGMIEHEAYNYVARTLAAGSNPADEYRLTQLKSILEAAYGLKVNSLEDDLVRATLRGDVASASLLPGRWLVNVFPSLMWVPSCFPGAGWKRQGKLWRKMLRGMNEAPFETVKQAETQGLARFSVTVDILRDGSSLDNEWLLQSIGTLYMAGADTTIALVQHFIFAMIVNPSIQRKAQEEIDRVIGPDRLPNLSDRQHLPYLEAALKEAMRWRPVAPIAVAHRLTQDDYYRGYLLPEGSIILHNIWAMSQDETLYPDPERFLPDRFLGGKPALDPRLYTFGVGRRVCPGQLFAEHAAFIAVAAMLASVNVVKAKDESGNEIPLDFGTTGRTMNAPVDFECRFQPRSAAALALVQQAAAA